MTAITPRIVIGRISQRTTRTRAARAHARVVFPRPPTYVVLCATIAVLNVIGLVMILSASSVAALSNYGSSWYFFNRQLAWALFGALAFVIAARTDYHAWRRIAPYVLAVTVVLLVAVLLPGVGIVVDGSRRWLGSGPLRMQPSEIAKIALLLFGADVLARRADSLADWRAWSPVLVVGGVLCGLVILEPDLDSTIVFGLIGVSMLLVAGVRMKHFTALAMTGVGLSAILAIAAPYRRARVFAFLDPWSDTSNTGYQIAQSLIALGSGGVGGVGLGNGRAKWMFLPNAHTDFIFAIVGEELGLVGCLIVLALFAGFGIVGFHVARNAPDRYGMLLAAGITTWVVGQAAINLGAVVGLLPVSGITLPFLSAGGSSLVFSMAGAGILANVARQSLPASRALPSRPEARTRERAGPAGERVDLRDPRRRRNGRTRLSRALARAGARRTGPRSRVDPLRRRQAGARRPGRPGCRLLDRSVAGARPATPADARQHRRRGRDAGRVRARIRHRAPPSPARRGRVRRLRVVAVRGGGLVLAHTACRARTGLGDRSRESHRRTPRRACRGVASGSRRAGCRVHRQPRARRVPSVRAPRPDAAVGRRVRWRARRPQHQPRHRRPLRPLARPGRSCGAPRHRSPERRRVRGGAGIAAQARRRPRLRARRVRSRHARPARAGDRRGVPGRRGHRRRARRRPGSRQCSCRCPARRATIRHATRGRWPTPGRRWFSPTTSATRPRLDAVVSELLAASDRLAAMAAAARGLARPDAAARLADLVEDHARL